MKLGALILTVLSVALAPAAPCYSFDDPADAELGFGPPSGSLSVGWLLHRVLTARDADASFIINGTPVYYRHPLCTLNISGNEAKLRLALDRARQYRAQDWRPLALLLEDGAAFYCKINRYEDSLQLLQELVELLKVHSPDDDLCNTYIGYGQVARADRKYHLSESCLSEAFAIARRSHDVGDPLISQVRINMYELYYDTGDAGKAFMCRRRIIRDCGYNAIADELQVSFTPNFKSVELVGAGH